MIKRSTILKMYVTILLLSPFVSHLLPVASNIIAKPVEVVFQKKSRTFNIVDNQRAANIVISPAENEVVQIAAKLFRSDVGRITGCTPLICDFMEDASDCPVIVGTIGTDLIDGLAYKKVIDVSHVKGQWETFGIAVVQSPMKNIPQALVIYGSDSRGTAYGLMQLSRMMGVSPWYWWADVLPQHRETVAVTQGEAIYGPPSVKYRGLFINDEDWGLHPWAAKHLDSDVNDIGPHTYEKVFELMLRLKANTLWPAMHPCTKAFWFYKECPRLARRYGIVLGSSHCEQMGRNNVDEWVHNFPFEYGRLPGSYSWKDNSETIARYWGDRVKVSKGTEMMYTLGMRGIHDSGLPGYGSQEERRDALNEIIGCQRQMLSANGMITAPQVFCPYKEALRLYRMGLNLPEDVQLLWVDDNFSYIRQLSTPEEQRRKGGGGVYYHFSYWGAPKDYLWLGATPPALTVFELMKAYEMNCRELWMFNVGDIKPIEYELQYAMDFSWDVNSISLADADAYGRQWGREIFGESFAEAIYELKRDYSRLSFGGKPEHVPFVDYTLSEMQQRITDYQMLRQKTETLARQIPTRLQDAYYELLLYPVSACAAMNEKTLYARMSMLYAQYGYADEATRYGQLARDAYRQIQSLTDFYNKSVASAKWDGMMDYAPRHLKYFYDPVVATRKDVAKEKISVPQSQLTLIPANLATRRKGRHLKNIPGLGTTGIGLTVWPLDMQTYDTDNLSEASWAEYRVPVRKGSNTISVRCLPSFPLYQGLQLRYAISINGGSPEFHSVQTEAETRPWSINVMRGYAESTTEHIAATDGYVTVRIYFTDPGLVINGLTTGH